MIEFFLIFVELKYLLLSLTFHFFIFLIHVALDIPWWSFSFFFFLIHFRVLVSGSNASIQCIGSNWTICAVPLSCRAVQLHIWNAPAAIERVIMTWNNIKLKMIQQKSFKNHLIRMTSRQEWMEKRIQQPCHN